MKGGNMAATTQKPRRRLKVLAFDGAKVHDFLYHVAMAEVWWQDLKANPCNVPPGLVQAHRARDRASKLYDAFLEASKKGPRSATAFVARQHQVQRWHLTQSQPILKSLQAAAARRQLALSEAQFGFQAIKSAATVAVAIIGLFLVGPEAVAGAGIAIAFDVAIELVKRLDATNESGANTVVIGFKQTMVNDTTDLAGETESAALDARKAAMLKTLSYPGRSSVYDEVASTASQLDWALRAFGILTAGVALYTEAKDTYTAFEDMEKAKMSYSEVRKIAA
jgi:hypothetical protein